MNALVLTLIGAGALNTPAPEPPAATYREGDVMVRSIDYHAKQARRERFATAGVGLGLAGAQLALGIYGTLELDGAAQRTSIGQLVAGSLGTLGAVAGMASPSALERMRTSPTYARVASNPDEPAATAALRSEWKRAAKKDRRRRLIRGGVSIGVGSLVTAIGAVRFIQGSNDDTAEQVWSITTLTTGLGAVVSGITAVVLPGVTERSLAGFEAGHPPRPTVRLSPSLGGMALSGRF